MPTRVLVLKLIVQTLTGLALSALLLFLPAGTLVWPAGWAFLILFYAGSEAPAVWLLQHDRALLAARMASPLASGQAPRDRAVMAAILVVFLAWFVFMALDAKRFGWSHAPLWTQAAGAVLMTVAFWGWFEVLRANSFAATSVRVQRERGQTVVASGPYALVRHPMYAATLLFLAGAPLMLGSLWGLAWVPVFAGLLAARILGEEALLRRDLEGYAAYAGRVRFRLLPGVW